MNITYANKNININNEPELVVIKEHIIEYYSDKDLYIFPFRNDKNKVSASFYINTRCIVFTSALGRVWISRIRCKKELVNKLTLIGIDVV